MYLADTDELFHYLAFDLDAGKAGPETAAADAAAILAMLADAGIAAVECQSGPTYGHHVWIAFADTVPATEVDRLGRAIRHLCKSIDLSPWRAVRGCVRPPGAPHRDGGASTVIRGSLDVLTTPTTSPDRFAAFVDKVAAAVDDSSSTSTTETTATSPAPNASYPHAAVRHSPPTRPRTTPAPSCSASCAVQHAPTGTSPTSPP